MASTIVPKRPRKGGQNSARRDAILAAARKVFAERGYEGSTIVDIAREAGVASGTVYLYYTSKTDLFAALNAELFQTITGAMLQPQAPPELRAGTRVRIQAVFAACSEHRDLLRLVFLNPDPRTEVARRMKHADQQRQQPLAELLRTGMEAGVVRQGDPALLAQIINGLVSIALYQCFVHSDGRAVHAYEDVVTDMIAGALAPA